MALGTGMIWLLPLAMVSVVAAAPTDEAATAGDSAALIEPASEASANAPFSDIQFQVERRVFIRITPLSRVTQPPRVSAPEPELQRRRPDGDTRQCIPIRDIAAVGLGEGRNLLLYMRDRRIIGTTLDRSCQVSNFYSGFYVERPEDGMLCAGREALHARSGADCMLNSFHEMEPADAE